LDRDASVEKAVFPLSQRARRLLPAAVCGSAALLVTHWPVAFLLAALATLSLKRIGSAAGRSTIARLEAIASWTEMLRDTLAGASGLTQAIVATSASAPPELKVDVAVLAERLAAGVPIESALRDTAAALSDPAADIVVASLVMATRERAQRLGDLLGALSESIREEVAMRLGVEASRSSARTAVRMITGFSLALFAGLVLFARSYLAPYGSARGQLVLLGVGLVFAVGLLLMSAMVRQRPLPRLRLSPGNRGEP
jgi:Flp pilus assembly protein TadB